MHKKIWYLASTSVLLALCALLAYQVFTTRTKQSLEHPGELMAQDFGIYLENPAHQESVLHNVHKPKNQAVARSFYTNHSLRRQILVKINHFNTALKEAPDAEVAEIEKVLGIYKAVFDQLQKELHIAICYIRE